MNAAIARVGDLTVQVRGVSYEKAEASKEPGPDRIALLRANNVTDDGLMFDDIIYVPKTRVGEAQYLRDGDIVVAASSGSIDVVGKAAQNVSGFAGTFGAFCKVVRPSSELVDARYLAHFFRTPSYRRKISQLAAGANINNLRNQHLDDLKIPLPSLEEQRRIATTLDAADALRAKRRAALARLDALAQSIFIEIFGDPTVNGRRYPQCALGSLIDPDRGISYGIVQRGPAVEGGIPVVRISDFAGGRLQLDALVKTAPEIERQYRRTSLRGGELIISIRGTVGIVAEVPELREPMNVSREVAVIPLLPAENRAFVKALLRTRAVQRKLKDEVKGVAQSGINLSDLREIAIIRPPLEQLTAFDHACDQLSRLEQGWLRAARSSDSLFVSLQHRAFQEGL